MILDWATNVAVPLVAILLTAAVGGGIKVSRRTPPAPPVPPPLAPPPGATPQTPIEAYLYERVAVLIVDTAEMKEDLHLIKTEVTPIVRWLLNGARGLKPTVSPALRKVLGLHHDHTEDPTP